MWAQDFLAEHQSKKHIIDDSWTPSGPVHIGSFRSLIIHDVLYRILNEEKRPVVFHYGFDDFDPMDGIPDGIQMNLEPELGKPLNRVPSPDGKHKNFADYFIDQFKEFHQTLGIKPEYYLTSQLYTSGKFNNAIRKVLDDAQKIREIYAEVSGSIKESNWYPLQVVCPDCGKLGSTIVTGWDGEKVSFACRKDLVAWAKGCGYQGKISPFDGTAKMPWRVEWAAKWDHFGVTIEAAGKDHASRGGSYDVAERILVEVFGKSKSNRLPHEFFLVGGKKMGSTKKGLGITPEQILTVVTPELFRFLIVRSRPEQAIEINLTEIVPRLYDEYDRCQAAYLEKTDQDLADYFYYSQVDPKKIDGLGKERFGSIVNMIQLPGMVKELGRPEVAARLSYAASWLEKYAPEEMKFTVQPKLPEEAKKLSSLQKKFLAEAATVVIDRDAAALQTKLYDLSKSLGLPAKSAFAAIYWSLLGKESGPRAGELIASQPEDFIKKRFLEASQ